MAELPIHRQFRFIFLKGYGMNILILGDVVGKPATEGFGAALGAFKKENKVDAVIVNGENACLGSGNGISKEAAELLFAGGADIITGGNHSFRQRNMLDYLDNCPYIIRPANLPAASPGSGYTIADLCGRRFLVMNLMGRVYMDPCDCPFNAGDRILEKEKGNYDIAVLDIHAEATSEKWAIADYFASRVNIIFGTHTHVPTADEQILPGGCAYITDVGMCGPIHSALGVKTEIITKRFRTALHERFELSDNPVQYQGILVTTNGFDKVSAIRRVVF